MRSKHVISTIDSHTGGEPTRLIVSGIPLKGRTLLEQRDYMRNNLDHLRSALMCEPRGHRGMFGAVMAPATRPEVDFGIIWVDHDGSYLNMCGHGTIGIGIVCVEAGLVPVTEPVTKIKIDMPAGLVEAHVTIENGRAVRTAMVNVPAFLHSRDNQIDVPGYGTVPVDIAFGGSFFAGVQGKNLGIEVGPENTEKLVKAGLAIRHAVNAQMKVQHPTLDHIKSVDLVTIWGPGRAPGALYKNIHVFSDGSFDRSPGGTGTSHMMTIMISHGLMKEDEAIVSEGITGSLFGGRMLSKTKVGEYDAWVPEISGSAWMTGLHQFIIDPEDPLGSGFRIG
ncbi:proline racemase/trans-L-3-hydroxyproline dehydratase [Rhodoligotrophos appendicifer]|uniref:proline racemase family protein n=1 Tax=Rhodoligotrophos appendicifer TaxID=987056 RepID=UPI00117C418C|nr:proline racemase family protein [Rhodoligotrophos appendicifer]